MKNNKINVFLVLFSALLLVVPYCYADGLYGTGDNFGSGWRIDSQGNQRGTGDNFGRGYRRDSGGNYRGTGDNFGRGWRRSP